MRLAILLALTCLLAATVRAAAPVPAAAAAEPAAVARLCDAAGPALGPVDATGRPGRSMSAVVGPVL